jgi:putative restriction endonuclease
MEYWWVNQNQTWEYEINGGFLWSPKYKKNGSRNQFYENMRRVQVGDIIFSYYHGLIQNLGTATGQATAAKKPANLGQPGQWDPDGWQVPVNWRAIAMPLNPRNIIDRLVPYLPKKYSPLQRDGNGLQGVYLAHLPEPMARVLLADLDSPEAHKFRGV